MRTRTTRVLAAGVVAALLVVPAACSGKSSGSSDTASPAADLAMGSAAAPALRAGAGVPKRSGGGPATPTLSPATLGRKLVTTATLTVRVTDLGAAGARATDIVSAAGGALYGENATSGPGGTSTLTLKVPPTRFRTTLDRLVALGTKLGETITTDDVTQQVTDVDTRVATLRDSIARVQALFDRAGTVVEVAQLDSDLAQRQAELESLLAQQRNLEAQVDLSTITLTLTRTAPPPPKPRHAAAKGFTDGLHGGWHTLAATARVGSLAAGAILPFLPLLALGAAVALLASRRRSLSRRSGG
ncbi:MAG TPA: DUF4349 domain-containing protein [Acidimicrobiales bacterium]